MQTIFKRNRWVWNGDGLASHHHPIPMGSFSDIFAIGNHACISFWIKWHNCMHTPFDAIAKRIEMEELCCYKWVYKPYKLRCRSFVTFYEKILKQTGKIRQAQKLQKVTASKWNIIKSHTRTSMRIPSDRFKFLLTSYFLNNVDQSWSDVFHFIIR